MERKNIVIVAMLLLVFLVLTGCNEEGSSAGSAPQNAETTADDAAVADSGEASGKVKISAAPPEGWEPVEGSVLSIHYMKGTASFMVKEEGFTGDNLDAVVAEAKSAFESAFDNVQYIGETESLTVAGTDARKLVFACDVGALNMKYEYVYLFAGNDVYAITFGDLAENFDDLAGDYTAILESISF